MAKQAFSSVHVHHDRFPPLRLYQSNLLLFTQSDLDSSILALRAARHRRNTSRATATTLVASPIAPWSGGECGVNVSRR